MRGVVVLVPVLAACVAAAVPFARHTQRQHDEAAAVSALRLIQAAQDQMRATAGGYATSVATLIQGCPGTGVRLPAAVLQDLSGAGYAVQLRAAVDATPAGHCPGHSLAADYYLAAFPRTAEEAAQHAFASRSDRRVFVFVDGIPPLESDMASGLATTLEAMDAFRIP